MSYIALLTGTGGRSAGCDYTIGCNLNWREMKAQNIADALVEAEGLVEYYGEIEKIRILDVVGVQDFDVGAYLTRLRKEEAEKAARKRDEEDRVQYEKLKQRFGQ